MSNNIVLGEAPESDCEDISLEDAESDRKFEAAIDQSSQDCTSFPKSSSDNRDNVLVIPRPGLSYKTIFSVMKPGSKLIGLSSSVAAPSESHSSKSPTKLNKNDSSGSLVDSKYNNPIYHSLYVKNYQLRNNLVHLCRQPYAKATKSLSSIDQELVKFQNIVHESDDIMQKLRHECENLTPIISIII